MVLHDTGHEVPGVEALERRTLDVRFELRGPTAPGPETVIVVFDNRTLAEEPHLFEKRAGWAKVINTIAAAGPKAIGIDAFFADPEQFLPADLARDIDGYFSTPHALFEHPAEILLKRVHAEGQGDAQLIAALRAAKNVVLGFHMGLREGQKLQDPNLGRGKYGQSVKGPHVVREAHEVIGSAPMFSGAARGLGLMTVSEDDTHSVRVLPLVRRYHDAYFAALSVQLVATSRGLSRGALAYLGNDFSIRIGAQAVPLGREDGLLLNFRGPAGTFPTYSAVDVMRGRINPSALHDRVVLLALTYLGHDTTRTAFGPGFPGVEVHATGVDNLLHGDWLRRASYRVDGAICLALGLIISLLYWPRLRLPPSAQVLLALLLVAATFGFSYFLFVRRGLWISWMGPLSTSILVTGACLAAAYSNEGLQRRRLRRAFAHYLADGIISELMSDPKALALGGARRNLSVLFSDIRNFTTISERLDPEQLIKILNTYLTPMTRAVLAHGGFLDKFIGDAVMAVFGAPLPNAEHPSAALYCVLSMHRALSELQPTLRALLGAEIAIGVGVNSGDMVVGNMGSDERFNYTVVGDAVNLSSRLEGLTKTYGVFCLVGENTQRSAARDFRFREIDLVKVKGKDEKQAIYELLGGPNQIVAQYEDLPTFERAVVAYRAGRFAEARREFASFAQQNPHDRVVPLYLERLAQLGQEAPPGWNGVYQHHSK